jgi:hypothetical protein
MNVNNISIWVYANGKSGVDPEGEAGTIYPRGMANIIYQDGFVWGGRVYDGQDTTKKNAVCTQNYKIRLKPL